MSRAQVSWVEFEVPDKKKVDIAISLLKISLFIQVLDFLATHILPRICKHIGIWCNW